jgi:HEXXH motif-containing protein
MSRKVAEMLDAGQRAEYQKILALKYMLLPEVVRDAAPDDEDAQRRLAQLDFLEPLPASRLVQEATPFFWQNVHRLYRGAFPDEQRALICDSVVTTAFDSFFDFVPDGSTVAVDLADGVILPRLRLEIPAAQGTVRLRRAGPGRVEVESPAFSGTLAAGGDRCALPRFLVHDDREALLLTRGNRLLLSDAHVAKLAAVPEALPGLAAMIRSSLDIITAADPARAARLTSLIRYYFPIATPDVRTTHNSFSAVQLIGVIFLSESYSDVRLVEAIVHEYHHNELHALMDARKLLESREDELYYSPWRDDPRPLYGLFHALHVFTSVVDFYVHALAVDELREHFDTFRTRTLQICWQLRTGLAQIREERLTADGLEIVDSMRAELRETERAIGPIPSAMPQYQERHLQQWRGSHAGLAGLIATA